MACKKAAFEGGFLWSALRDGDNAEPLPEPRACRHKIRRRIGGQAAARQGIASVAWSFHVSER